MAPRGRATQGQNSESRASILLAVCWELDRSRRPELWISPCSYIEGLRIDNSGVAPFKENGKMHADPLDKSNILNRQYESTFTQEDEMNIPQPEGRPYPPMPDIDISRDGVLKLPWENLPKQSTRPRYDPDTHPERLIRRIGSIPQWNISKILGWCRSSHELAFSKSRSQLQKGRAIINLSH